MAQPSGQSALRGAILAIGNVWLGVALLGAICVYAALASTVPHALADVLGVHLAHPGRSTQPDVYAHPLFVTLCGVLCLNILAATVARIPLRPRNAGAWISHAGLLVLAGGSMWYTARSLSGDAVSVRTRQGFSPIRHVYLADSHALYVYPPAADSPLRSPLPDLLAGPKAPAQDLDVAIDAGIDGVSVRVSRYYPALRLVERWRDRSPNRVPAVQLRVDDGRQAGTIVLSPSLPGHRQFGGRDYVMVYQNNLTPAAMAKVIAPGDPNAGPRMPHTLLLVMTGPQIEPTLAVVRPGDRQRWHARLQLGESLAVPLEGRKITVEPLRFFDHAAKGYEPADEQAAPPAGHAGHAHADPAGPALRLEIAADDFRRAVYLPFGAYEHLASPNLVDLPGNRGIWLTFSRDRIRLPEAVQILSAEYQTYPASGIPKDYRCEVRIGDRPGTETLSLNHPVHVGGFQLSQNTWGRDPREPTQISLGAKTRPALGIIWLGCALVCLGLPIAFYVKPLLMRRKEVPA